MVVDDKRLHESGKDGKWQRKTAVKEKEEVSCSHPYLGAGLGAVHDSVTAEYRE